MKEPIHLDEPVHRAPSRSAAISLLDAAALPTLDLTDAHMEHFFYSGLAHAPSGLVGLELFGHQALLRSLVVSDAARSRGLGSALLAQAEEHARAAGVREIYLLTTTAAEFFRRRGFSAMAREGAPPAIRESREFAGLCPASSAFMIKRLDR
jgi:amino-acid N-acetyltransferase